jgi:hypothetical protein
MQTVAVFDRPRGTSATRLHTSSAAMCAVGVLLSACSGAGGSATTSIPALGGSGGSVLAPQPSVVRSFEAPAAATTGGAPSSPEAVSGGANLNGWDWANALSDPRPPNGTVFPLLQSVLTVKPNGNVTDDNATMAAGATVTVTDTANNQVRIQVPSLGIDITTWIYGAAFFPYRTQSRYVFYGSWVAPDFKQQATANAAFVLGYVTPPAAVPASGSAVYGGDVIGTVIGSAGSAPLVGKGSLTVDFTTHAVAGSLTQMRQGTMWDEREPFAKPFNSIAITATQSGNQLNGTTSVTSSPANAISLSGSATGFFNGALFGPAANEVGAVWTLSDDTHAAMGILNGGITK